MRLSSLRAQHAERVANSNARIRDAGNRWDEGVAGNFTAFLFPFAIAYMHTPGRGAQLTLTHEGMKREEGKAERVRTKINTIGIVIGVAETRKGGQNFSI